MTNIEAIKALRSVADHLESDWSQMIVSNLRAIARFVEDVERENPAAGESKYSEEPSDAPLIPCDRCNAYTLGTGAVGEKCSNCGHEVTS